MEYLSYGMQVVIGFVSIYMMVLSVQFRSIKKSLFIKLFCAALFLFLSVVNSIVCACIIKVLRNGYEYTDGAIIVVRCLIIGGNLLAWIFYVLMALFAVDAVKLFRSKMTFLHAEKVKNTESNRGVLILTFGIMGVIICPLLGVVAWVMGRSYLNRLNANNAPESSDISMAKAGVVLGKIATFFVIAIFFLLIIFISNTIQHLQYCF